MNHVGMAELKARLSDYLARVQSGEEIVVTDRGRPVARLIPVATSLMLEDAHLLDLQRRGLVRLGTGTIPDEYWEIELPADPEGTVLAALLEEREEGR